MRMLLVASVLLAACSTTKVAEPKRTLPSPLVAADLPERPDATPIPPGQDWAISISEGQVVPVGKSGIIISPAKAVRAARYVIQYDELRGLYLIDLRTWGRERQIYERYVVMGEDETKRWMKKSERTWLEKNGVAVGLTVGIIVGAAIAGGTIAAVQEVRQ